MINFASAMPTKAKREYQIKANFLYQFLFYTTWPERPGTLYRNGNHMVIGILGEDPFGDYFDLMVKKKRISGKRLVINRFKANTEAAILSRCHILYINPKLEGDINGILESINGRPVLTVSEIRGFCKRGGMINFMSQENSVFFEINHDATEQAGIVLSSKLLRVAYRIVDNKIKKREEKKDK